MIFFEKQVLQLFSQKKLASTMIKPCGKQLDPEIWCLSLIFCVYLFFIIITLISVMHPYSCAAQLKSFVTYYCKSKYLFISYFISYICDKTHLYQYIRIGARPIGYERIHVFTLGFVKHMLACIAKDSKDSKLFKKTSPS